MRRQVKPFVTEYRASTRKSKDVSPLPTGDGYVRDEGSKSWADMATEAIATNGNEALRAADALFQRPSFPDEQKSAEARTEASGPAPRRILESIEPEAAPEHEPSTPAEPPRRRGRKPGSKNKPKMPAVTTTAAAASVSATPAGVIADPQAPAMALAASPARARPVPTQSIPRRRDAFSWIRKTLKPGERWKRRLPKVAW